MNQSKQKSKEGYNGIYLERSGIDYRSLAESLIEQPEILLSEAEKSEVYFFESLLAEYELPSGVLIKDAISSHADETAIAPMFFAEGIMNMGAEELGEKIEFDSSSDVYKWLAECIKDGSKQPKELLQISKNSVKFYKSEMSKCLEAEQTPSAELTDRMSIVVDPARFLKQAANIDESRVFLKDIRKDYHEGGRPVDGAKRVIIDIYLARINSLLSNDIVYANYLLEQSKLIDDDETADLAEISVSSSLLDRMKDPEVKKSVVKRLDFIRNGQSIGSDGGGSAVSAEVGPVAYESEQGLYSEPQINKLKQTMVNPGEVVGVISNVMQKADLLSSEPAETWYPNRGKRASDQKYQVVENPGLDSFATNGDDGVFKVASEARSLYDLTVVGPHELTHIAQSEADAQMGKRFVIAGLKGKRVAPIKEAGANTIQRMVERKLFGTSKPIAMTYPSALKVLESGGDLVDATRAFYEEKLRAFPGIDRMAAAKEASDRVLRLVKGGGIDSQSMSYAEESILNKEMQGASSEVQNRATLVTCLDLVDQKKLHKYGLLPEVESRPEELVTLLLDELAPRIDQELFDERS